MGAILRAALNFGPTEVYVTSPARPSLLVHPDFELMSHGGEEARKSIHVVDTLEEALVDCHYAVAFTARARKKQLRHDWRDRGPQLQPIADDKEERLALIFGNEETGLTREEALLAQEVAHLRTAPEHTSLNLAQAVIVVLYSLFTGTEVHQTEVRQKLLDERGRTFLKERLKEVLAGRVAMTPSAAVDITAMIDRVFTRAELEPRDARAWHLVLRALGSETTPAEFGLSGQERDARRKELLARHLEEGEPSPADGDAQLD